MENLPNQNFQNTTGTYYVAERPAEREPKKGLKGLLLLEVGLAEIIGILLILALFFEALNFFNIISLSSLYPNQLGWLPHQPLNNKVTIPTNKINNAVIVTPSITETTNEPKHDAATDTWTATGILIQYNDNLIKLKAGNEILNLVYSYEYSAFLKKNLPSNENATPSASLYTLYDLDKKENLGKTYEVIYITDKSDQNVIQSITEK